MYHKMTEVTNICVRRYLCRISMSEQRFLCVQQDGYTTTHARGIVFSSSSLQLTRAMCWPRNLLSRFFGLRLLIKRREEQQAHKYSLALLVLCCTLLLIKVYSIYTLVFSYLSDSNLSYVSFSVPLYPFCLPICYQMSCQWVFFTSATKTVSSILNALGELSDSDLWFSCMLLQILEHKAILHGNGVSFS